MVWWMDSVGAAASGFTAVSLAGSLPSGVRLMCLLVADACSRATRAATGDFPDYMYVHVLWTREIWSFCSTSTGLPLARS